MQNDQKRQLIFTIPSDEEKDQLRTGLAAYVSEKAAAKLIARHHIVLSKGRRTEVYLLTPKLWQLFQQIGSQRHPYFLGLFLGELTKTGFRPSLHILPHLTVNLKPSVKVIVNDEGEQRFLYGRTLTDQHFKHGFSEQATDEPVVIVNRNNEGLGYGRLTLTRTNKLTVNNQLDLGWYLRRGR